MADHAAESIKDGASTVAYGLLKYYTGNNTGDVAGNLPDPYYCKLSVFFLCVAAVLLRRYSIVPF